ncbi:hypothetical protein L210DRAFT_936073, partial [Boletus edulis BED1]
QMREPDTIMESSDDDLDIPLTSYMVKQKEVRDKTPLFFPDDDIDMERVSKRPAEHMESSSDEEELDLARARRQRMDEDQQDDDDVVEYTWHHYFAAMVQHDFEAAFQNMPVLLRILQDILSLVPEECDQQTYVINNIRGHSQEPSDVEVMNLITSFRSALSDLKYITAAEQWGAAGYGMHPTHISDDIYGKALFAKVQSKHSK